MVVWYRKWNRIQLWGGNELSQKSIVFWSGDKGVYIKDSNRLPFDCGIRQLSVDCA